MFIRRMLSCVARTGVVAILFASWPFLARAQDAAVKLTKAEVAELVRPVAMYPDSLLQTMLAASTFPDQIVDASMQIKSKEDAAKIEKQTWDESVKVIATYPGVLETMSTKIDWTSRLGEAFLTQTDEVLRAIQDQRLSAVNDGELESDSRQKVTTEEVAGGATVVQIEPTDPQVVYVPTTTYVEGASGETDSTSVLAPLATFGLGMALGAAFEDDDDYHYGGWGGPGFWYDEAPVNQWMDNRRAVWEDYNDRAWDRQEFRQEQRSGRQDPRQDQIREGTRKPPTAEQRAQAQQKASERRAGRQAGGTTLSTEQRAQAQQRASERRAGGQPGAGTRDQQRARAQKAAGERLGAGSSSMSADQRARFQQKASARQGSASRGWSSGGSSQSRSAFSGMDSKARVNQARSRGVSSRSMSSSRASFGGGGRSMGGARGGGRGGGGRGGRR